MNDETAKSKVNYGKFIIAGLVFIIVLIIVVFEGNKTDQREGYTKIKQYESCPKEKIPLLFHILRPQSQQSIEKNLIEYENKKYEVLGLFLNQEDIEEINYASKVEYDKNNVSRLKDYLKDAKIDPASLEVSVLIFKIKEASSARFLGGINNNTDNYLSLHLGKKLFFFSSIKEKIKSNEFVFMGKFDFKDLENLSLALRCK